MRGFNIEIFPSSPKGLSIRGRHCDVAFMCGSRWRLLGVALPPALPGSHTLSLPDYRYLSKAKVRGIDPGIHLFTWEDRVFWEFVIFLLLFLRGLVWSGAFSWSKFWFSVFICSLFFSGWCDGLVFFFFVCFCFVSDSSLILLYGLFMCRFPIIFTFPIFNLFDLLISLTIVGYFCVVVIDVVLYVFILFILKLRKK